MAMRNILYHNIQVDFVGHQSRMLQLLRTKHEATSSYKKKTYNIFPLRKRGSEIIAYRNLNGDNNKNVFVKQLLLSLTNTLTTHFHYVREGVKSSRSEISMVITIEKCNFLE